MGTAETFERGYIKVRQEAVPRVVFAKVTRIIGSDVPCNACQQLFERRAIIVVIVQGGATACSVGGIGVVRSCQRFFYVGVAVAVAANPRIGFLAHPVCLAASLT